MTVLYTCVKSRGFRASWTAAELGIPIEYRILPFPPRVHQKDYLAVNPLGTVPMLVDREVTLTESSAIAHYLATRDGPSDLVVQPGEADYGPYLDFLHHADATLTFPQTIYMRFAKFERDRGLSAAGEAYAAWFKARLVKVENRLEGREFLCSERFTVADIAIAYALWLATMIGLTSFLGPRSQNYLERMMARPGFSRALAAETAAAQAQGIRDDLISPF